MKNLLFAGLAVFGVAAAAPAWAGPSYCTGTTQTVASLGSVAGSFLVAPGGASTGNCVEAGDKIFGGFSVGGVLTGGGSASFTFFNTPGNVTIGFAGAVGPSSTGDLNYSVAVDPALSEGFLITGLEKDFTLNSANGGFALARLTGTTTPVTNPAIDINCTRTVNPTGATCPETDTFAPVDQLNIAEILTTGANANVTALTDTIFQSPPSIPEPGSLGLLGVGLLGLGFLIGRKRSI
jgi:hypothetical protein